MTEKETEDLLKYILTVYPGAYMPDDRLRAIVCVWSGELAEYPREKVADALRVAMVGSPSKLPSLSSIKRAMQSIDARIGIKDKEQEFRDSHCGKSEAQWRSMVRWEQSEDGKARLQAYKSRLLSIIQG